MHEVAEGVWQVPLMPRDGVNAYLLGDVLVDSGTKGQGKKVAKALAGRPVAAHAITHAHADHIGGSAHVCRTLGVPFWCPAGDAGAAREGRQVAPGGPLKPLLERNRAWEPVEVARELREGDEVAGFTVLDAPGHSPGHVAFWRESDRTLVAGDVWFNLSLVTFRYGLRQPPNAFTMDPERNRQSMRRLAELEPSVACFGHGRPITGAADELRSFVARL
ncbi:MAG TPA: MBL fold metallo-hydrolase [Solirubrobacteraceae bacterium]|nr:MBL fold metallo-hydrolase [Solirubrobacteraceae bacterium]